jgi:hypothetical protein
MDYQNKIKNITPTTTNEDINITDDNNIANDVLVPVKKSFLEAVKLIIKYYIDYTI